MMSIDKLGQLLITRQEVLQTLSERPYTKCDLVDELEIPRSTLDDIARELDQAKLIEYIDGQWHVTLVGRCMIDVNQEYLEQLSGLTKMDPFVDLPASETSLDPEFLIGADLHQCNSTLPDRVVQVLLDNAAEAMEFRIFTPSVLSAYVQPFYEQATAGEDPEVEIIVPPPLFDQLRNHHSGVLNDAIDDPCVSFFTASIPTSFGLWIADDDVAGVITFSESGIQNILINDSPTALEWAEDQYRRVR